MRTLWVAILAVLIDLAGCQPKPDPYAAFLAARIDTAKINLLNANTLLNVEGKPNPYRRKVVEWDPRSQTCRVVEDPSPFKRRYEPANSCADSSGFVKYPNVDVATEEFEIRAATEELRDRSAG
jgi:flagellar basal body rod protein FlgC